MQKIAGPEAVTITHFYLFTTSGCHLCEQAEAMLRYVLNDTQQLQLEEISNSDELMQKYGIRIPVLGAYSAEGEWQELGWPFGLEEITTFIAACYS
ncbi:MAG: glutaredoxin family protein [Pseudomonadota bacterium]